MTTSNGLATAACVRPPPVVAPVRLSLLRSFELRRGDDVVRLPMGSQRLLAFLALNPRAVLRLHVAGKLWPDAPEERACANLRSALWRLHRPGLRLVEATPNHLQLGTSLALDVREVAGQARRLLDGGAECLLGDWNVGPLCSDLLPDWYDDWVLVERERFRQMRLHALEALSRRLTAAGRFAEAIEAGLTAVAGEPLRESAHRVLVRAYLAEGNPGEALRQYRWYRKLLRESLGLEPSPLMEQVVSALPVR